jgi:hypothetical protein
LKIFKAMSMPTGFSPKMPNKPDDTFVCSGILREIFTRGAGFSRAGTRPRA